MILSENLVDSKEIGKLKLEYVVSKAYFISNKLYCLVILSKNGEKSVIVKAKGIYKNSLKLEDF